MLAKLLGLLRIFSFLKSYLNWLNDFDFSCPVHSENAYREVYENITINFHLKNLVLLEIKIHNCS